MDPKFCNVSEVRGLEVMEKVIWVCNVSEVRGLEVMEKVMGLDVATIGLVVYKFKLEHRLKNSQKSLN